MERKKMARTARAEVPRILEGVKKVVAIESIAPHPENARRGNVIAIKKSIAEVGFYGRVLVWEETGQILVGSHRWKAALELGMKKIPAEFHSLTERQARKILTLDNRTSDLAGYDDQGLANLLVKLRDDGDLDVALYEQSDLDGLLKRLAPPEPPGEFKNLEPGGMHLARECPRCHFQF
jgi:hypothetical protein